METITNIDWVLELQWEQRVDPYNGQEEGDWYSFGNIIPFIVVD
jgi:hypothetical protein